MATHQVDSDGAAVFSESFSYYPNASMHQRTTDNLATTTYFPDGLGRLKSVVFDADASMTFEYDDTGTRTGVERPYGNHFSYLHEAGTSRLTKVDHLASEASVEFAHDGNGNVIAIIECVFHGCRTPIPEQAGQRFQAKAAIDSRRRRTAEPSHRRWFE